MDNPQVDLTWSLNTPLYKLVATRLGESPIGFILRHRSDTHALPYAQIAELMRNQCNVGVEHDSQKVYLTHEVPRRWLRRYAAAHDDLQAAAQAA